MLSEPSCGLQVMPWGTRTLKGEKRFFLLIMAFLVRHMASQIDTPLIKLLCN